jgi:organic hydroperoxide reductase OsmC/OhrA
MPTAPFPHTYSATLEDNVLLAGSRAPILTGPPPQFGGTNDVWSPEHLLISAALACLKTTFDAFARRDRIQVLAWRGTATGVLVKGREGPVFESIELAVELTTDAGDEARAQATLADAERHCIVSRALSAPVHVTSKVTAEPERAAQIA